MRARGRLGALLAIASFASGARATDVFEFPDNGTEQLSRAGAWVARATNPLATFQNPAGLAGQETGVLGSVHLVFNDVCFTRQGQGAVVETHEAPYRPDACDETALSPLPAIAGVLAVTDRLGIGLSIAPPPVYGTLEFPDTVEMTNRFNTNVQVPNPAR